MGDNFFDYGDIFDDDNDELMRQASIQAFENNNYITNHFQNRQLSFRGSIPGHVVINRDRDSADRNLFDDYFSENPRFPESMFRPRFRMGRPLFLHIFEAIHGHDNEFIQRRDGVGKLGLSGLQKLTVVFRMLAYGASAYSTDEYIKMGKSTVIASMNKFCRAMVEVFGGRYLRAPNANDVARLQIGEQRGFLGMLGSLDCMHWKWKNCPTAWAGQYAGRSRSPSIIFEVVADYDLWIWHAYFGLSGSNHDINVLESSHLFANLAAADSIYPKWATLVQTFRDPQGAKKKLFAKKQEACRKDVERAFGVLQSRLAIVVGPARFWGKEVLHDIMTTCIIMYNMIIEDERNVNVLVEERAEVSQPDVEMIKDYNVGLEEFLPQHRKIKNKETHLQLRNDLIERLWQEYSNSKN